MLKDPGYLNISVVQWAAHQGVWYSLHLETVFITVVYILFAWLQLKAVEEHYAKYYDK